MISSLARLFYWIGRHLGRHPMISCCRPTGRRLSSNWSPRSADASWPTRLRCCFPHWPTVCCRQLSWHGCRSSFSGSDRRPASSVAECRPRCRSCPRSWISCCRNQCRRWNRCRGRVWNDGKIIKMGAFSGQENFRDKKSMRFGSWNCDETLSSFFGWLKANIEKWNIYIILFVFLANKYHVDSGKIHWKLS